MKLWHLAIAIISSVLAALVMMTINQRELPPTRPQAADATKVDGMVNVLDVEIIRVGGKRVQLCGVRYTKAAALRPFVINELRKELNGTWAECLAVNQGTICDGRSPVSNGTLMIAQCRKRDGTDLALRLSEKGLLCDFPERSGGAYRSC